ncbi:MAG: hypothetical protein ACTHNM_17125 [Dyella sp.]|uniref:hypothetical protein n=1 Tax=Dyella sp. TaxID=1869338 RepID=UPI003F810B1F
MSPGLWHRMRSEMAKAGEPITIRELARRLDALDETAAIRSVLYTLRKRGGHVARLPPKHIDGHYRWELIEPSPVTSNDSARV